MITGCTAQRIYVLRADFHNVCGYPVRVIARDYNNSIDVFPIILDQDLNNDEKIRVFSMISNSGCIENGVFPSYSLEISHNGNKRSFNKDQFIELLGKSKRNFRDWINNRRAWTIKDPSLCPVAEENTENLQ
jgi:hypothetical protein